MQSMGQDISVAGLKASPGVTVFALTLNEWVAIATVLYLVLQAAFLIWKWREAVRDAAEEDAEEAS